MGVAAFDVCGTLTLDVVFHVFKYLTLYLSGASLIGGVTRLKLEVCYTHTHIAHTTTKSRNNKHLPYHTISVVGSIYLMYIPNDAVLVRPLIMCTHRLRIYYLSQQGYESSIWYTYTSWVQIF